MGLHVKKRHLLPKNTTASRCFSSKSRVNATFDGIGNLMLSDLGKH